MKAGSWRCYACGRTQPRIEVKCHCEWWKERGPWLREMLDKLIYDISPEPFPFISGMSIRDVPAKAPTERVGDLTQISRKVINVSPADVAKARGLDRAPGNS